jgi:hypothetical protein
LATGTVLVLFVTWQGSVFREIYGVKEREGRGILKENEREKGKSNISLGKSRGSL